MTTLYSRPIVAPAPKWGSDDISDLITSVVRSIAPYNTKGEVVVAATIMAKTLQRTDVIADYWINVYDSGVQVGFHVLSTDPFTFVSLPC